MQAPAMERMTWNLDVQKSAFLSDGPDSWGSPCLAAVASNAVGQVLNVSYLASNATEREKEREREREREHFTRPFSPHWLMRTLFLLRQLRPYQYFQNGLAR